MTDHLSLAKAPGISAEGATAHAMIALTEQVTRIANALEGSPAARGSILPASETSEVAGEN